MRALSCYPFHCLSVQVLCIVIAEGGGQCSLTLSIAALDNTTARIAVHSTKRCYTATTIALTSINEKVAYFESS